MNVVVKAGSTSVLLRDALRRPLAELELGGIKAGLRSLPKGVVQVRSTPYLYTALLLYHQPAGSACKLHILNVRHSTQLRAPT